MKICACAPGTLKTSRVAAIAGGEGTVIASTLPAGMPPKRRCACGMTSALFTSPLTASTIWAGTYWRRYHASNASRFRRCTDSLRPIGSQA